jgi:MFS transporter, OPA family, sugar phosphate sensor protein UhpC
MSELPAAAAVAAPSDLDRRYRSHRWQIIVTLIAAYGIAYVCRLPLSVVKKPLIDGGIFTAEDLGRISSLYLYGYGLGKLVNGFLSDRLSIRWFFPLGIFLSALMNLAMGMGSTVVWLCATLWGLNGLFQGVGAPACVVLLTRWFSNKERGHYYGIWSASHSIGEGLTFVGTAALVHNFGWRAGFIGPGVLCAVTAVATWWFLIDGPDKVGLPPIADWRNDHAPPAKAQPLSIGAAQLAILKMPSLWVVGLSSALMYVTRYAINNWGVLYLQEAHGYSIMEAGSLIGLNTVVGIAGAAAYGILSDWLFKARRPPLTLIFGAVEVLSLGLIFFAPKGNHVLLALGFILYGFTLSGLLAVLGGLFGVDLAPKRAAGAVMGFIGVFSYLGAGLQDEVSGRLIQQGTTMVNGVRHYDFSAPIVFWIASSVISMLLAASLWRARPVD